MTAAVGEPRRTLRPADRVRARRDVEAVYAARTSKRVGPLVVHGRANGRRWSRIGFAIPRRVGNAVRRHRVRRCLREAFRLHRHEWPVGLDLMVNVTPHDDRPMQAYVPLLEQAMRSLAKRLGTAGEATGDEA